MKRSKITEKIWKRALKVIPTGNMLLSKNPNRFLPNLWPTYYKKAKDCFIWGVDGNKYTDLSTMGFGTNILGYANTQVDRYVQSFLKKGNMSTLNSPEEVFLAEKLIELHPWFHMVRFARTGGEANSIAVRIARAASKKDNIAICGYHGWHDWYLSSNLDRKDNLDDHLLPNLEIAGVPKALSNTVFPFKYNDIETLTSIVKENNIGTIKMEVSRSMPPKDGFFNAVYAETVETFHCRVKLYTEAT